jgi:phosphocarrier protein
VTGIRAEKGIYFSRMELQKTYIISNELGLHARSAAKIVELAGKFDARLYLGKDGSEVDGGSILSILTLACPKGTEVTVRVQGKDAKAFMEKLRELFEQNFGESQ